MTIKNENSSCCSLPDKSQCNCKVESIISVDERGQMVLPKEVRDKAEIQAGDKLAVVSWKKDGKVCCIALIKANDLSSMVKDIIGPMMEEPIAK